MLSVLALPYALSGVTSPHMHQCLSTEIDGIASREKHIIKPDNVQKLQGSSNADSIAARMLSSEPTALLMAVRKSWKSPENGRKALFQSVLGQFYVPTESRTKPTLPGAVLKNIGKCSGQVQALRGRTSHSPFSSLLVYNTVHSEPTPSDFLQRIVSFPDTSSKS